MNRADVLIERHEVDVAEEWRPIPSCPGYEASSQGRILSLRGQHPLVLKQCRAAAGYLVVKPYIGGKPSTYYVHVLIAEAFLGPRPAGLLVRHVDGDNMRNAAVNLRYGTDSENGFDQVRHGTHYQSLKTHCPVGHPYDAANTIRQTHRPTGGRKCRACSKARAARRRAAQKAALR